MITAGLKLGRGGCIAVISEGSLEFNVEFQHRENNPKQLVPQLLAAGNYAVADVDEWVIDGSHEAPADLPLAGFFDSAPVSGNIELDGKTTPYTSYSHFESQVAAAYCSSPFAGRAEPSSVVVWEGGYRPRSYQVDARGRITPGGELAGMPRFEAPVNLCFTGERALDPELTSSLRADPMVRELWVPPFADGSGSAIGAAVRHLGRDSGLRELSWNLRRGQELPRDPHVPDGWSLSPCRPEELARLLHRTGRPAVVLTGRAKLGPKPLGSRSVIAPAVTAEMRNLLTGIRLPVAALCLADQAAEIFDPGFPDPYMTFQHRLRPEWEPRIPAITPVGMVQTVSAEDDPTLVTIVREYAKWSGIPVLCHTHADDGAFTDATSAMRWGEIGVVWSDGVLYRNIRRGGRR